MKNKKERDFMAVFTKPVDKPFITTKEGYDKIMQSYDPEMMQRILKNAEKFREKSVDKGDKKCTDRK